MNTGAGGGGIAYRGGGEGISGGENFGSPKFWCLVYSCGNHSPWDTQRTHKKVFWNTHWVHKIILWDRRIDKKKFLGRAPA